MPRKPITNKPENNPTIHERLRINSGEFAIDIENFVRRKRVGYIEAILEYCDEKNIEIEQVKELVQGSLKSKLEAEAERLHFFPPKAKLPV